MYPKSFLYNQADLRLLTILLFIKIELKLFYVCH